MIFISKNLKQNIEQSSGLSDRSAWLKFEIVVVYQTDVLHLHYKQSALYIIKMLERNVNKDGCRKKK